MNNTCDELYDKNVVNMIINLNRFEPCNKLFFLACRYGHENLIDLLSGRFINNTKYWRHGIEKACEGGHVKIVKKMTSMINYTDLNSLISSVCEGGNIELINWVMSTLNESQKTIDLKVALFGASLGGHQKIVKLIMAIIKKTYPDPSFKLIINFGFVGACCNGNKDIINMTIENGATDWHLGFVGACSGGHMDIVSYVIQKFQSTNKSNKLSISDYFDWDDGMQMASAGGHVEMMRFLLKFQKTPGVFNLDGMLANRTFNLDGMLIINLEKCFVKASKWGHLNMVMFVAEYLNHSLTETTRNEALHLACEEGHVEIVRWLLSMYFNIDDMTIILGCINKANIHSCFSVIEVLKNKIKSFN